MTQGAAAIPAQLRGPTALLQDVEELGTYLSGARGLHPWLHP